MVEEQGYATTEAASSLGIRPELIRHWIRERQADDGQAFRGNGKGTPEQEEIKRLKTKIKRLEIKRVFDLVKDFGTSQSTKIDSIFDSLLCPDRQSIPIHK
ncbi:MAG: transposase [Candidatus Thiodiazotropha sp. (ex Lucinoma aequizonata)]|nr:transposase [Candidatus Thiodiazotropha sp. (ex Lucinoma aequizonata)]